LGLGSSEKLSTTYVVGEDVVFRDGRAPSEFAGCFAYTRPSGAAGTWGPGILRVTFEERPLVEDWTARVTSYDPITKVSII
jgi:hypothetical protein